MEITPELPPKIKLSQPEINRQSKINQVTQKAFPQKEIQATMQNVLESMSRPEVIVHKPSLLQKIKNRLTNL